MGAKIFQRSAAKIPMASGKRDLLAPEKISATCCSLGEEAEILGGIFGAWDSTVLDTRTCSWRVLLSYAG